MNVNISGELTITDYTEDEAHQIKASLVTENPTWVTAMSMNKSLWGIEPKLRFYTEANNTITAPVGFLSSLKIINPNLQIDDNRYYSKTPIQIEFTGELRDYQKTAVDVLSNTTNGVLCSITASGKTVIACALLAKLKQPTLILVDTIELAHQFIARLKQFTSVKNIGKIGAGERKIKQITVGLLQSVKKIDQSELNKFGMIICDEVLTRSTYYV